MMAVRSRHFVHQGSVTASGFMIRLDIVGLREARKRVLSLWQLGLHLKRIDDAFIVLLAAPVRVMADEALGEPLVRHGALWIALPLAPDEIGAETAIDGDTVVFAKAGRVESIRLAELPDEDVAQWIDVERFAVADVVSLGPRPESPVFRPSQFDARHDIPGVPPASSELERLLAELRRPPGVAPGTPTARKPLHISLMEGLQLFRGFVRGLASRFRPRQQAPGRGSPGSSTAASSKQSGIWLWLQRRVTPFLAFTRLSRLMNSRHARYLASVIAMMQYGDIDEGLRHAVPLADATSLVEGKQSWFGFPRRRSSLSINPYPPQVQSAWKLQGDLYNYLRDLYRQAFQRLESQGRIEEAAFVLTELLSAHGEAVSFLEKHGKLRLAAEIAEARKLSPAMAIRLWWLAGDSFRALALACRTGEFEKAIHSLAGQPEKAAELRVVWAARLALSGKYVAAAEAVWPVKAERHRTLGYLNQAIELGGTAGAMALARKGARFPKTFDEVLPIVEILMAEETAESARTRNAFVENLRRQPGTPETQVLARLATRSFVRDVQQGIVETGSAQLRHLLDSTGDSCLRADVPPLQALNPDPEHSPQPALVDIAASDIGSRSIRDLALLPQGRLLLALGESGLLLLSRDGRVTSQFNQPAQELVVSDEGSCVLGIARRGSICRLVRFDALSRKVMYWCDTSITAHTETFDGSLWCVANGRDMFLIDTLAQGFEVLWSIPDLDGEIRIMRRNRKENQLHVVTENQKHLTTWTFDYPSCVLRSKKEFNINLNFEAEPILSAHKQVVIRTDVVINEEGELYEVVTVYSAGRDTMECQITGGPPYNRTIVGKVVKGAAQITSAEGRWLAITLGQKECVEVFLYDTHAKIGAVCLRLRDARGVAGHFAEAGKQMAVRFADNVLLCADNQGRVLALNTVTGRLERDHRI